MAPTNLAAIDAQWRDVQRFDSKFLLKLDDVQQFINEHCGNLEVLEIDSLQSFRYVTEYYDTPAYHLYRDHYMRRRRRIKVRIRHYLDSDVSQCEVKARHGNSQTRKFILPECHSLNFSAREFITGTLATMNLAERLTSSIDELTHVATTTFDRITLNRSDSNEKITIDLNLSVSAGQRSLSTSNDMALVEIKSMTKRTRTRSDFARFGMRPVGFSKYAAAIDLLVSHRYRVNSRRTLQHAFGFTSLR